ncbi:TetR/AcrR family transcriptional regulator [Chelativorans sp.]|uniref:TetR/AcrR family transcriptional regulator n=1 Tax=Chelativorans sp. TaxID=2203393 RepID=UPI002811F9E6|nr:TetR/AcrR family transcriptional regulator [Chelativorans sp.]
MGERGRPRSFDRDEALRKAMELFWSRGYEGTSVGDLTEALGINKPSLYAAFGCKEALFREAIELYGAVEGAPIDEAMREASTARAAVEAALRINATAYCRPDRPTGCMVVLSAITGAPENETVRAYVAQNRQEGRERMRQRIERGKQEGDVPKEADAAAVAGFYTAVLHGLSVEARDGARPEALAAAVDCATAAWDAVCAVRPVAGDGR